MAQILNFLIFGIEEEEERRTVIEVLKSSIWQKKSSKTSRKNKINWSQRLLVVTILKLFYYIIYMCFHYLILCFIKISLVRVYFWSKNQLKKNQGAS